MCYCMAKNKFPDGGEPSQRQLRVGELIRRTLSEVLAREEIHDADLNRMLISVTEVCTSPDLRVATVYVIPLGGKNGDEAVARMARHKYEFRRFIGKKTALKFTPDLRFRVDDTFDRMDATREMFARDDVRRDIEPNPNSDPGD